jgi:carbon storage regulator
MLVLSRLRGESVIIGLPDGRTIEVTVTEIRGDKVRLGVQAPMEIPVHRREVFETIRRLEEEKGENPSH